MITITMLIIIITIIIIFILITVTVIIMIMPQYKACKWRCLHSRTLFLFIKFELGAFPFPRRLSCSISLFLGLGLFRQAITREKSTMRNNRYETMAFYTTPSSLFLILFFFLELYVYCIETAVLSFYSFASGWSLSWQRDSDGEILQ